MNEYVDVTKIVITNYMGANHYPQYTVGFQVNGTQLALKPVMKTWKIVHLPTGRMIDFGFKNEQLALQFCLEFDAEFGPAINHLSFGQFIPPEIREKGRRWIEDWRKYQRHKGQIHFQAEFGKSICRRNPPSPRGLTTEQSKVTCQYCLNYLFRKAKEQEK